MARRRNKPVYDPVEVRLDFQTYADEHLPWDQRMFTIWTGDSVTKSGIGIYPRDHVVRWSMSNMIDGHYCEYRPLFRVEDNEIVVTFYNKEYAALFMMKWGRPDAVRR